jgi:FKBP-type peptidyl-prolyl cis-trans isomerase
MRHVIGWVIIGCGFCGLAAETGTLWAADQEKKAVDSKEEKPPFQETKSGLKFRVLREGKGAKPKVTDTVKVHYRGWLDDGKEFDSSYKRNEPISFPLSRVIAGWTEGMQLVGEGGEIELEIPSRLGYGSRGVPGTIPADATLHFIVELIEVKAK